MDSAADPPPPIESWKDVDDLSWSNFGFEASKGNEHFGDYLDTPPNTDSLSNLMDEWNKMSSAKRACVTFQKPFRLAVHASQMIPKEVDPDG